ncbi:hypothetical protein ONA91_15840 [Micromonospora sp. DR5-3]|uniref:hypothetical protein n=1 Tax=unclassified Micromonospora TaxID=2617518 RepID=UPI0011D8D4BC|nr:MULTISPECIES: hypothetical protein [unclassified Micromonospora]MCW3815916.1 hypothetical protein [Micromonospora sp. DR5-3]TYC24418.1 hypothetical protein FXF52_10470 [Micromonospora sp. MP36]
MVDVGPQRPLPATSPAPEEPRPRLFTVALALVWIGVVVGALDLAANTVGLFTAIWVWRGHIDNYPVVLLVLAAPAVVVLAAIVGTLRLLRRARARSRRGRVGLASLMFCFVPGAAVNYSITELFFLFWAVSDWATGGNSQVPNWAAALLAGSMIADGVLLLLALAAGILLVLPISARHANLP